MPRKGCWSLRRCFSSSWPPHSPASLNLPQLALGLVFTMHPLPLPRLASVMPWGSQGPQGGAAERRSGMEALLGQPWDVIFLPLGLSLALILPQHTISWAECSQVWTGGDQQCLFYREHWRWALWSQAETAWGLGLKQTPSSNVLRSASCVPGTMSIISFESNR